MSLRPRGRPAGRATPRARLHAVLSAGLAQRGAEIGWEYTDRRTWEVYQASFEPNALVAKLERWYPSAGAAKGQVFEYLLAPTTEPHPQDRRNGVGMYETFYEVFDYFATTGVGLSEEGRTSIKQLFEDGTLTPPSEDRKDWFPGQYENGVAVLQQLLQAFKE
jgi:hypothetical protein